MCDTQCVCGGGEIIPIIFISNSARLFRRLKDVGTPSGGVRVVAGRWVLRRFTTSPKRLREKLQFLRT